MVVAQGEVFWADLPMPPGSEAGFRRPVVVVQGDAFNRSLIRTVETQRSFEQTLADMQTRLERLEAETH